MVVGRIGGCLRVKSVQGGIVGGGVPEGLECHRGERREQRERKRKKERKKVEKEAKWRVPEGPW